MLFRSETCNGVDDNCDGIVNEGCGGSSSGGGGSSSNVPDVKSVTITNKEQFIRLKKGSKIKFNYKIEEHELEVTRVYLNAVEIVISSKPKHLFLVTGQATKVDIDGDLKEDVEIKAIIVDGKPNISIMQIPEPTCNDAVRNQGEELVDCGGPYCGSCTTCEDGIQNQNEEGIDCGGPCQACPSCSDGIINQGEEKVDCGGPCEACIVVEEPKKIEFGYNITNDKFEKESNNILTVLIAVIVGLFVAVILVKKNGTSQ